MLQQYKVIAIITSNVACILVYQPELKSLMAHGRNDFRKSFCFYTMTLLDAHVVEWLCMGREGGFHH